MAILYTFPIHGLFRVTAQLLTNQNAAADGEWIDLRQILAFNIHFVGFSGTDAVQVGISNEINKPANSDDGLQFDKTITANYLIIHKESLFSWLKVHKNVGGGTDTNAYFFGAWIPLK